MFHLLLTAPETICSMVFTSLLSGHNVLPGQCTVAVSHSVCLPMMFFSSPIPMIPEICPTFRPTSPFLPLLLSFFSKTCWPPGMCVSGSAMYCEWSLHQTLDRAHSPHRYSAHTLLEHLFRMWLFSPLVPFLCLTCLPSLNQYGWLDNFTRSFMPKGTLERETQLLTPLLNPFVGPLRRLS